MTVNLNEGKELTLKKLFCLAIVIAMLSSVAFAGVVKKSKAEVNFKELGKFTTVQEIMISPDKKLTNSKNNFKGKGVLGSTVSKLFLKSGDLGEIINLPEMQIYDLNHKKKEYGIRPIEKIDTQAGKGSAGSTESTEEDSSSSNTKITRSEFKVEKTGDKKNINDFLCVKYLVTWIVEWENMETGQKGTDNMTTDVWTTALTDDLKQAQQEENEFNREYMKRMGIDVDEMQQAILGTNWLSILSSVGKGGMSPQAGDSTFAKEMNKIEGYPVVIDGKYFAKREGGEESEEEEDKVDVTNVKGTLGRFAKKAIKGKEKDDNEPVFSYYVEVVELHPEGVKDTAFVVPSTYKNK